MTAIVFDVNETLLDLQLIEPQFERIFGDASLSQSWFAQLLQHAMVATLTERYRDFGELAVDALGMVADQQGVRLDDRDKEAILSTMRQLPPHSDVKPGLERLKEAGFRLAALTNSPYRVLKDQLVNAELCDYFDQALSVDEVERFKPHPAVYKMAADKLGVKPADMMMVAAHNWDTTGALCAGCKAAFLARPGKVLAGLDAEPDIIGASLPQIADEIIAKYGGA